jgi:hypothetical protein
MYVSTIGLWWSCRLAAKASRRRRWQYALAKYHLSQSMYVVHFMDLDPSSHTEHQPLSRLPQIHLRLAYAIITAYSVLEDLGLGLSQRQLASKVGAAGKAVVYQWESDKRKPSPVFWLRIERLRQQ